MLPLLSSHTQTQTGSLEQQAVSFFLRLLSSKLFHLSQRVGQRRLQWKELSGEGPEVVFSEQAGREQGGSPGRASPRLVHSNVWFGRRSASPPPASVVLALCNSRQPAVAAVTPVLRPSIAAHLGLLVLTTPACSCHSHYLCCHYPCYTPSPLVAVTTVTTPVRFPDSEEGRRN